MIKYIFVCICLLIPISLQVHMHDNVIEKVRMHHNDVDNEIIEYLDEGHRELWYRGNKKVYLIGLAGEEKTTTALLLGADNSKLIAKDVGHEEGVTTGLYYIADETGSLGNSRVHQKDIISDLLLDHQNNIDYYNLPAIDTTRDVNVDVTSVYFVKEIVDISNEVKFILNINHDSVRIGGSRVAILILLEHVSRFIMDVDKYQDAIGMVITNVNQPQTTDESVIRGVAVFLEQMKMELQRMINEKPYYETAIKIIDVLLQKTHNKYERMSLLRSPDRPGSVIDIPVIQNSKMHIQNMITKHIKYVKKSDDDFNYVLSDKSQNHMVVINKVMNDEVFRNTKEVNNEYEKHFRHIHNDNSISNEQKRIMFTDSLMIINEFINHAPQLNTADKFMKKLSRTTARLNIWIPTDIKTKLIWHMNFLDFLEMVSYIDIRIDAVGWVSNFKGTVQFLEHALNTLDRNNMQHRIRHN